jgi:hypothetical protein
MKRTRHNDGDINTSLGNLSTDEWSNIIKYLFVRDIYRIHGVNKHLSETTRIIIRELQPRTLREEWHFVEALGILFNGLP